MHRQTAPDEQTRLKVRETERPKRDAVKSKIERAPPLPQKQAAERTSQGHINLQETLCDDVARMLLAHPHVMAVRVSTEKPDVYEDCDSIGVEIFRFREDL